MKKQKVTPEFLKSIGFTDCATTHITRSLGLVYWYLGEDGYISNSDLLITMEDNGTFLVRYRSSVTRGLRYVSELKMALKLFNCYNLVKFN